MSLFENNRVLLISNEEWEGIWFSKHHYANELSLNNEVYFVNPALQFKPFSKIELKKERENFFQLSYSNIIPFSGRFEFLSTINDKINSYRLKRFLKRNTDQKKDLAFFSFDPQRFWRPNIFQPKTSYYLCMDPYSIAIQREQKLAQSVDVVAVISESFKERFVSIKDKVMSIDHAVSPRKESDEDLIKGEDKGYFLMFGMISYRTDFKVLIELAQHYTDRKFLFAGPIEYDQVEPEDVEDIEFLMTFDNIEFLGTLPYEELTCLIKDARVCLATYKLEVGNMFNSLKVMQYLNYGKPVITSFFEAYQNMEDILWMSDTNKDFLKFAEEALSEQSVDEQHIKHRLDYIKDYTYRRMVEKIKAFSIEKGFAKS